MELDKMVIAARNLEGVAPQCGFTKIERILYTRKSHTNDWSQASPQIIAAAKRLSRTVLSVVREEEERIPCGEARELPTLKRFLEAVQRTKMKLDATVADRLTHTEYQIINIQLMYYRNMVRGLRVFTTIAMVAGAMDLIYWSNRAPMASQPVEKKRLGCNSATFMYLCPLRYPAQPDFCQHPRVPINRRRRRVLSAIPQTGRCRSSCPNCAEVNTSKRKNV